MKTLCLTFDDGCSEDADIVRILNEHGARATFYLNSGLLGQSYFHHELDRTVRRLSADEARGAYAGQEIGAHTATHPMLNRLTDAEILREVASDRAALTSLFGSPPPTLALPFGPYAPEFRAHLGELLAQTGFLAVRTGAPCDGFASPSALLLNPQCGFPFLLSSGCLDAFLAAPDGAFMCVCGHGYELDLPGFNGRAALHKALELTSAAANVNVISLGEALSHGND